ncbi:MAG: 50S ribosomal protein L4 [Candidatus Methanomethylicia archaeon]|nr:50S ribosomal protein L4 [Candidatus Methanomethylicia archaeon]MCX8169267.1 50S ribosomal protein L4 [Candidatus Methanomethylicia archaeon]MDW7988951.1 50S ribosomal protein L4 [Nitrososphaerota archaeon]
MISSKIVKVYSLEGQILGEITLPWFFLMPIRKDLIRRAYLSSLTAKIQPQGRDPLAGKRTSAESLGVGYGIARVPRVKGSGYPEAGTGAFAAMTVGGRRPHAPNVGKIIHEKINEKERIYAILSAISATANLHFVSKRGHIVSSIPELPLIVSNELENINSSKQFREVALNLGLLPDLERVKENIKIRAGKGKMRGRKYKVRKGPLIVISNCSPIINAVRNFPGLNVVKASDVSVIHLAPGGNPGRLTVWTQNSLNVLSERFSKYEGKHLLTTNVFNYL